MVLHSTHYLSLGGPEQSNLPAVEFQRISAAASRASGWYFEPDISYPAELDDLVGPEIIERFAVAGPPVPPQAAVPCADGLSQRQHEHSRRPGVSMYQGLRETMQGLSEIVPEIHAL